MATITFDTLKFVNRLEQAGMSREQASAVVEAQKEALAEATDNSLATKNDVMRLERRMDGLDAKVDKLVWMQGVVLAGVLSLVIKQFF